MKNLVLLSGGLDSATILGALIEGWFGGVEKEDVITLSILYGQKHSKEIKSAKALSNYYKVNHEIIDLNSIGIYDNSNCSLIWQGKDIPNGSYVEQINNNPKTPVDTYVPFRNGLFVSISCAYAMTNYPDEKINIFIGAHANDSIGNAYPDTSKQFCSYMNDAILYGTNFMVSLKCPFIEYDKNSIVSLGLNFEIPYELTWSCYNGDEFPCGKCATCIDRYKAFKYNDTLDPLVYVD